MQTLNTPFGFVCVTINGAEAEYECKELEKIEPYTDDPHHEGTPYTGYYINVEGNYKISPIIPPNTPMPLKVECFIQIPEGVVLDEATNEDGEHLAIWSMYKDNMKVSIGCYDYYNSRKPEASPLFAYWIADGRGLEVRDAAYLEKTRFNVAWVTLTGDDYETNEEIYTWRAADPAQYY